MFQKPCNLARVAIAWMGGGGGGSSSPFDFKGGFRSPSKEKDTFNNWFLNQMNNLDTLRNRDPFLSVAGPQAISWFKNRLPDMLSQFPGFGKELEGVQGNLKDLFGGLGDISKNLGGLIPGLQGLEQQGQDVFGNLGDISGRLGGLIPGIEQRFGDIYNQLGAMAPGVERRFDNIYSKLGEQAGTLGQWLNAPGGPASTIASQGALSDQMGRDVSQQYRNLNAAGGNVRGTGSLGQELLNRDAYRQQRYNTALGQGQGLLGQQQGVYGQQAQTAGQESGILSNLLGQQANVAGAQAGLESNIFGQQAGIAGQQGGILGMIGNLMGQEQGVYMGQAGINQMQQGNLGMQQGNVQARANLLGQEQALQTAGLNQVLGAGQAGVSQYGALSNPALAYLGQLFGGNQQAAIAAAQMATQSGAAGDAAKAGTTSSGIGAVGSIIGGIAMAY